MAELKTQVNENSVDEFLELVSDIKKREDSYVILNLLQEITGEQAKMWGTSIIGFGSYRYKYKSGREGEWMQVGFSPRKQALTLYIMSGFSRYDELLAKLGKFKTGKSCLYIKKIEDVNIKVLQKLIEESVKQVLK